ncbi:MAG: OmpA family protein [Rhodobacteraceae bacterium]|nr:OmpA family protein [Paracoccaceae bacterium]
MRHLALAIFLNGLAAPLWATPSEELLADLPPQAQETASVSDPPGRYGVASGIWTGSDVPFVEMNGTRLRQAYRMPNVPGAMADTITALSQSLTRQGFEIVLSCIDLTCGGFDFRHRLEVLPLPGMYVDLGSFRYVSGMRGDEDGVEKAMLSILASASGGLVYLQIDLITPLTAAEVAAAEDSPDLPAVPSSPPVGGIPQAAEAQEASETPPVEAPSGSESPAASFAATGEMVLEDVSFAVGSMALTGEDYPSLTALAAYIAATPDVRIVLVGHTDTTGTLEGNVRVSRSRAQAVANRLVEQHGVARSRLRVEGAGYLAPRADNRTEAGRALNRRVTAVLLPPS